MTDRDDSSRGFLGSGWPIIALALILLVLLRACVPSSTAAPPTSQGPRVELPHSIDHHGIAHGRPEAAA